MKIVGNTIRRIGLAMLLVLAILLILPCGTAFAEDAKQDGDIVILYTSDVHCGIDEGFGYVGVQQIRESLCARGDTVLLVDDGDAFQGEPVGTMTRGEAILDLMNKLKYDVVIPGNHDFDYGVEQFLNLTEQADFPYICCNFTREGERVFNPSIILEANGKKIGFVGVTTPETLTGSRPTYFQNDNGEFIYGFCQDETGEALYSAVQDAVDDVRGEGADYVVVLAHLGNAESARPWNYADVISNTTGYEVMLDGHSHDTDQVTMKNKDGNDVIRSACGTKLACVGYCRITPDGKITCGLYTWNNTDSVPSLLGVQNDMSEAVTDATKELDEKLGEVVASTAVTLTINDPTEVDTNGRPIRMIRRAETNLGDLCADAYCDQSGADIAIIGGGGIRDSIQAGDVTLNDILKVHPFGNYLTVIEVTGQQILDALEWGSSAVPGENGGFMQVSGLSYEIDTAVESTCRKDEDGMFTGVEGERRVRNVLVAGEPIDPEKTYSLAGVDYWFLNRGDGFTMFEGAKVLQDRVKLDNQVLIDYITETLGGVIGEEYEDPYGQGRIVIMEEEP
ncbi:MAG: bifunctional metallophosphatase/5'-nucleotidase [Oscillospiraceae bacterium]|nr:bifunctional metallophosphatase/5'-nucleotidase [Oscillospiraceae bacterium]